MSLTELWWQNSLCLWIRSCSSKCLSICQIANIYMFSPKNLNRGPRACQCQSWRHLKPFSPLSVPQCMCQSLMGVQIAAAAATAVSPPHTAESTLVRYFCLDSFFSGSLTSISSSGWSEHVQIQLMYSALDRRWQHRQVNKFCSLRAGQDDKVKPHFWSSHNNTAL